MTSKNQHGGEAILQAFRQLGIEYVFSSPGSEWAPVWEAFASQQVEKRPGPAFLNCGHETLAVDLAIGYSAITRRMQAVMLHAGSGLLQGSMGINAARMSATPMIVLSGESLTYGDARDFDPGAQWYGLLGVVGGPQRLVEPLVKWGNQATSPETLYDMVIRAGEIALRTPAGPTYLNVPLETMLAPWAPRGNLRAVPYPPKPRPADADIERVARMLAESTSPLIVTDSAGREPEGYAALVELAELLAIPVIESSVASVSNFPKEHPLHQGFDVDPVLETADLVLLARSRIPWYPPSASPKHARVVVLDEQPFKTWMVYQNLHGDDYLEGDVPSTLGLLCEAVRGSLGAAARSKIEARRGQLVTSHERMRDANRAAVAKARQTSGLSALDMCATLAEVLPENAAYLDETTMQRSLNARHLGYRGPHSFFRVPSGLGQCLGFGLGIKLANPQREVVCLVGDGSLLYNPVLPALGFSREHKLPLLVIVFNNHGYRCMSANHRSFYPKGVAAEHDLFVGETLNGLDYAELAKLFGGVGLRVRSTQELRPALQQARDAVRDGKIAIVNAELS
ncbi:MAG: thiamine pyrophosphate-binding protein [Betaproteobacteria bacterium]|nr:thiamine pyrophosphate-binding protein [Betaproteobacteria bacterium]